MRTVEGLTGDERAQVDELGYVLLRGFADPGQRPGDLLVFDSHLIHRSGDNTTGARRAAMTFHFAATGTTDLGHGIVNDFVTVRDGD